MLNTSIYPETQLSPTHSHTCYFTYLPQSSSSADHWSTETPLESPQPSADIRPDPHNPFLAARPPLQYSSSPPYKMDVSKFLQLQTAAAHGSLKSDNSSTRSSSTSSGRSSTSLEATPVIQDKSCSRCQTTYGSFVSYSLNSYYCTRCAKLVGYNT